MQAENEVFTGQRYIHKMMKGKHKNKEYMQKNIQIFSVYLKSSACYIEWSVSTSINSLP